jgi:hypothetical protein
MIVTVKTGLRSPVFGSYAGGRLRSNDAAP